ncbi:MAG: DUF1804 family protein, partial [Xanthomonadales bacterium]|nr:DUF1804 family protein [Xanthomonadales bacterium]
QIIEEFMIMFNATVTAIKDDKKLTSLDKAEAVASLSDSYIKITKAATTMSPRLHKITVALEVIKDYTDMVYQEFPQLAGPVIETLEHFANLVQEKYG